MSNVVSAVAVKDIAFVFTDETHSCGVGYCTMFVNGSYKSSFFMAQGFDTVNKSFNPDEYVEAQGRMLSYYLRKSPNECYALAVRQSRPFNEG